MNIIVAHLSQAPIIHDVMIQAFAEYRNEQSSSSALSETVAMIEDAMQNGEHALICFSENTPVGIVRYQLIDHYLYFYRLSVLPTYRGKKIASQLITALEREALKANSQELRCKVRMNIPRNMSVYQSRGFTIIKKELLPRENGIILPIATMAKKITSSCADTHF